MNHKWETTQHCFSETVCSSLVWSFPVVSIKTVAWWGNKEAHSAYTHVSNDLKIGSCRHQRCTCSERRQSICKGPRALTVIEGWGTRSSWPVQINKGQEDKKWGQGVRNGGQVPHRDDGTKYCSFWVRWTVTDISRAQERPSRQTSEGPLQLLWWGETVRPLRRWSYPNSPHFMLRVTLELLVTRSGLNPSYTYTYLTTLCFTTVYIKLSHLP